MRYLSKCLLLFTFLPGVLAGADATSWKATVPTMVSTYSLKDPEAGKLLVASRDLEDPYFRHRVIFLLAHDDNGTIGLIVDHPMGIAMSQILTEESKAEIGADNADLHEVRFGGPVLLSRVAMLLRDQTDRAQLQRVGEHMFFSNDTRAIQRVLKQGQSDSSARFYLGHAGWLPGQLELELLEGAWFLTDADVKSVFADDVSGLWQKLIVKLDPPGTLVRANPVIEPFSHTGTSGWHYIQSSDSSIVTNRLHSR